MWVLLQANSLLTPFGSILSVDIRADSPRPWPPRKFDIVTFDCCEDEEKAFVTYMPDLQVYDSGYQLTVFYQRNRNEPEAVENKILDSSHLTDAKNDAIWDVVDELVPNIPRFYPTITGITLKTIGGKLTTTFAEDVDEIIHYLPIPSHLCHILTVPISELRKFRGLDMDVDRVKRQGIVVNRDNTIRGFLSPFIHAGDLESVFRREREKRGPTAAGDVLCFNWPIKLSWARQITRGVVELHSISAFNRDLKPKNVLIGRAGHWQAILIDFLPVGISEPFAAPEVLEKCHDGVTEFESVLTAPADVHSLGLLLHVVAEENLDNGDYRKVSRFRSWARPSAAEVLSLLEKFDGPL